MPTIPPPISSTPSAQQTTKPSAPPTPPPQPMSSSKPATTTASTSSTTNSTTTTNKKKLSDTTMAAILFFAALFLLCALIGAFLYKSYSNGSLFKMDAPALSALPEYTNKSAITVEGTTAKNATVEITNGKSTVSTSADKTGKFMAVTELKDEGKVTFTATATKKVLFFTVKSSKSNEVSTTYDKSAPNMKLITLPKNVSKSEYTITGSTSEPTKVTIKVNDKEQVVETDKDNKFSAKVSFVKGTNSVTVIARDSAGNETASSTSTVTYSTGTVKTSGSSTGSGKSGTLPNSSGELQRALDSVFGRTVAMLALVIGGIGYAASTGAVWLFKTYKKNA